MLSLPKISRQNNYLKKSDYSGKEIWRVRPPDFEFGNHAEWILDSIRLRGFHGRVVGSNLQKLECQWGWEGQRVSISGHWFANYLPDTEFFDWVDIDVSYLPLPRTITSLTDGYWVLENHKGACWIDPSREEARWYAAKLGWNVLEWWDFRKVRSGDRFVWGDPGSFLNCWLPLWNRDLLYATWVGQWKEIQVEPLRALIPLSAASKTTDFREKKWEFEVTVGKKDPRWVWLSFCARRAFMSWAAAGDVWLVGAAAREFDRICTVPSSRFSLLRR